ncbi:PQQ-binding-like beta-propeller repeat protein [Tundrisphaera lichenicola]|uniref:outer membrane protein assembly factor BamB family protein n=1 Tax=Tundrisphaera lichenicola TaxID=2029860 RepID=UPI003EC150B4
MATLEVHDAGRRVRRIRISHDNPVMFGSDPMCEVVLDGPGVQPFHGRIRWSSRRFKVDISPDAPWIEVNGTLVKSKGLHQGDEIRIGHCRIFLLSLEDGPDHGEKTVVRPPTSGRASGTDRPRPATGFRDMEMAPPSIEQSATSSTPGIVPDAPTVRKRTRPREKVRGTTSALDEMLEEFQRPEPERSAEILREREPVSRFRKFLPSLQNAPGDDRVFTSPMVLGLGVAFLVLVLFSVVLYRGIARATAHRLYTVAVDDMDRGDFINAIHDFDRFIAANPDDPRSTKAKVLRALARVRQHTGKVGASWGTALDEARGMVEEVGQTSEYRDSNMELAEDLRKTAEGLAERAANLADPETMAQAQAAVELHARVAGQASDSLIARSKIGEKLGKARFAILKSQTRTSTLAAMDRALESSRPADAYAARDVLVRRYHDLSTDREVVARLVRANDQIRQAVSFDPSGRPGETEPHRDPLRPPISLALRLDPGQKPSEPLGQVAYAITDGLAVGLDVATGAPLWQVPVGVSSSFPPLSIAGDAPSVLIADARHEELLRLDGRTGALIWRQETGGAIVDPPLLLGNQVLQPMPDGRLLQIDLASGDLRGTLKLGRRLTRTPVADDSGEHLYQLAEEDCLFVLTLGPLACVGVEYLGHEAGSIPCPPARVARYLVLPENHLPDAGRLRVFVIDEDGTRFRQAQEIPVGGWTRSTPASAGSVIWSSSDRGELAAFAIGLYDAKTPFTMIAQIPSGTEREGLSYGRARSDRDFLLASSRSGRFELDLQRGRLASKWTLGVAGPTLAPPQIFDRRLVLTQRNEGGPGTAFWGVDLGSGAVLWRTILGANWPLPPTESTTGDALTSLSSQGEAYSIDSGQLHAGGFIEQEIPKAGRSRLPSGPAQHLKLDQLTVIVPAPGTSSIQVRDDSEGEFHAVLLPAPLGASIAAIGGQLLVPGQDGRVYLIDPRTGTSAADPYIPPFDRSRPTHWRSPVLLDGGAVALADSDFSIRRLTIDRTTRPRLVATSDVRLESPMVAELASTGSSVLVATADGRVRSLASRDLSPQGSWPLGATRLLGPIVVADHGFVVDSDGEVMAFGPDGRRLWTARLDAFRPIGAPAIRDGLAWFLGLDGSLHRLSMVDGSSISAIPLNALPDGGPLTAGPELVIPTGPGTLRLLDRAESGVSTERTTP